jgi:hypothetical protein
MHWISGYVWWMSDYMGFTITIRNSIIHDQSRISSIKQGVTQHNTINAIGQLMERKITTTNGYDTDRLLQGI